MYPTTFDDQVTPTINWVEYNVTNVHVPNLGEIECVASNYTIHLAFLSTTQTLRPSQISVIRQSYVKIVANTNS